MQEISWEVGNLLLCPVQFPLSATEDKSFCLPALNFFLNKNGNRSAYLHEAMLCFFLCGEATVNGRYYHVFDTYVSILHHF